MTSSATAIPEIDPILWEEADSVFKAIGMTTLDAVQMFLRQAILEQGLPLNTSVRSVRFALPVTMSLTRDETLALRDSLDNPLPCAPALSEAMEKISSIPSRVHGFGE